MEDNDIKRYPSVVTMDVPYPETIPALEKLNKLWLSYMREGSNSKPLIEETAYNFVMNIPGYPEAIVKCKVKLK